MTVVGAAPGRGRPWFAWIGLVALLLLGLQAVRAAVVAALGERRPDIAAAAWSSHPDPQLALALGEVGAAARRGEAPPAQAIARIDVTARSAPLGEQPLLVAATGRLAAGDRIGGERLLRAALKRDPRSTAAHFLLADLLVREGRLGEALINVTVLGRRLGGNGTAAFSEALAVYLRQPQALAAVKPVLDSNPELRDGIAIRLAGDPLGADALRRLVRRGDGTKPWFAKAFELRLAAGDVSGARALLTTAGVPGGGNALTSWTAGIAPGPLSWRLETSSGGVAEAAPGSPMRLVYYGRADTLLAAHLLLLPPGRYGLQSQFAANDPAASFEWRLTCVEGNRPLASWPIRTASNSQPFAIPADCPAQRLALWGRMGEFPRTVTAELAKVAIVSVDGAR